MRYLLLIGCGLLVMGCAQDAFVGVQGMGRADTTTMPAGTRIDKLKARTVIIQYGRGSVAAPVDNTKARSAARPPPVPAARLPARRRARRGGYSV